MTMNRRSLLKASIILPLSLWLPGAPRWAQATPDDAETLSLAIHTQQGPHRLDVELADTLAERQRGLMQREHLPAKRGMLFVFDNERSANNGFWMYQTLIPLDIAFIDAAGRIVAIDTMQPCESSSPADCPSYAPGAAYHAALEVNAGYFAERGIGVGDCVSVPALTGFCQPEN
ncbi:hypothetical protein SAMN04487958_103158 [Vreelandella subterranea]|uniref:DUF192 domain-containing protein n=1 Tax=Vreelandella subterranea TaxID=416874 RepID=A0A1H9SB32_9GAMM|nr:DUF192 domain-containing protein [Halomonas subterranea]SER82171.1 hypothetical protein SAMN04487958_103158 [Halomonas subterranea]